ncbi:MAG: hypothetical protein PHE67_08015 [Campylobacterales bacterium]|nr:hypothetical protein [Campylobacterales bacterium]
MNLSSSLAIALLASAITISSANAADRDYAVGLTAGTMGIGVSASTNLIEKLNLRANISGYEYKHSGTYGSDVNYDIKMKLFGTGLLADYFPFDNGFRLTGGAYYNGNKFTMDSKSDTATVTVGNNSYSGANTSLKDEIKYQKIAPYIGLGWGNPLDKDGKIKVGVDVGAMYTGSPKVSVSGSSNISQSDLAIEQADIQKEADKLKWWPLIAVSVTYKF